jgi:hypothetical protein
MASSSATAKPSRFVPAHNVQHSWELRNWPPDVWPHDQKRAEWVTRAYRQGLIDARALTRIGKTLVILGAGYTRWLEQRAQHVAEFTSNNPGLKRTNTRASQAAGA